MTLFHDWLPYALLSVILGYLFGSVPFALVIGRVFYKIDIREHGSKNPGGSNAGRVLGKKVGIAVMALDVLKVLLAMLISSLLYKSGELLMAVGFAAALGHCYPVFARFKGGKAVAAMYGFFLGMVTVGGFSPLLLFVPLSVFLLIIFTTRVVALSSIGSALAALLYCAVLERSLALCITVAAFSLLLILRHRGNIARLIRGEENKVKWIGRK